MSLDTIAVGVFSIVGTLLGGALGLFGERWVRYSGPLLCEPSNWSGLQVHERDGAGGWRVVPLENESRARGTEYTVDLDLFNGKEVPAGLWHVRIVLECEGGELVSKPLDRATGKEVASR